MHQHTLLVGAMPMRRPRRTQHHIPRPNAPWLLALVADPAAPTLDLEDLAALVAVPERAAAGQERDVVGHHAGVRVDVDDVHVHVARECRSGFFGRGGGGQGAGGGGGDYR